MKALVVLRKQRSPIQPARRKRRQKHCELLAITTVNIVVQKEVDMLHRGKFSVPRQSGCGLSSGSIGLGLGQETNLVGLSYFGISES